MELAWGKPNMRGHVAKIATSIKATTIHETHRVIRANNKRGALDLPENCESLTSMARAMALKQCSAPGYLIDEFRDARAQENALRSVRGPSGPSRQALTDTFDFATQGKYQHPQ